MVACKGEGRLVMDATGKCCKCGKQIILGIDGSCKTCHAEACWECWVAEGHNCPACRDFEGKKKKGGG